MIKTLGKLLSNLDSKPVHSSSVEKSAPRSLLWQRIGSTIKEPFAGAWQQNRELTVDDGLSYPVVFACVSRISEDLSKIAIRHERRDQYGIFKRVDSSKFSKLLKNPNLYQDRQKFIAYWESCIQSRGNAYIFKERTKGEVTSLHVLHPDMVTPLITATGAVYYQINISAAPNDLTGIKESQITVPASEIIHDRINCFFHPLVGLSPLYAAAINVWLGKKSQEQQAAFFENGATPGGILIFPGNLDEDTAVKIGATWNKQHSGEGKFKTAVLGDGVTYQQLGIPAEDTQLIEQLRFGAEMICGVFHMPPYKISIGNAPSYGGIEQVNQMYFSDCLQSRIMAIQSALNNGLGLPDNESFRFDLDSLLLMDTKTRMEVAVGLRKGGIEKIDEARMRFNRPPVDGGNAIYLQQQDHSLEALARRDENAFTVEPEIESLDIDQLMRITQAFYDGSLSEQAARALIEASFDLPKSKIDSLLTKKITTKEPTPDLLAVFSKGFDNAKLS